MKNQSIILLIVINIFLLKLSAQEKQYWNFYSYAEIVDAYGNTIVLVEYGIKKKGYSGAIKWRVTNNTSSTITDLTLKKRTYTLRNGAKKNHGGESIFGKIKSGQKKSFISDAVNTSENKGAWSDKNDNQVTNVIFPDGVLSLAFDNKKKVNWIEIGKFKFHGFRN